MASAVGCGNGLGQKPVSVLSHLPAKRDPAEPGRADAGSENERALQYRRSEPTGRMAIGGLRL